MEAYDQIAELYRDSKRLPFRQWIERYTLFDLIGDARGLSVLDAACGEGHYTRMLREAGATEVVGIDISAEMVRLAQAEEARRPLGCRYVRADAADYEPERPVDLVLAAYLLNCAPDAAQLFRVLQALHDALKPGGRLVGVNDDVGNLDPLGRQAAQVRPGARAPIQARRRRRDRVHRHQPGRSPVRVRQLLLAPEHVCGRVPTGRFP